jgi:hypothetical protein
MAGLKRDTGAALENVPSAEKIKTGTFEVGPDFDAAQLSLNRTVRSLGDLVPGWQALAESSLPLGANRVGESVSRRFVEMGGQFSGMLRDYLGKLSDADAALQGIRLHYDRVENQNAAAFEEFYDYAEESIDSVDKAAQYDVLEWWTSFGDWTPADRTDWTVFESEQLTRFATENNDPSQLQKAAEDWVTQLRELEGHSTDFADSIAKLGSAWSGSAADAAQAALVPLWEWTSDAAGNADRIRENLSLAGDAAARVRQMPGPVNEFQLKTELHESLLFSPAEQNDLLMRQQQAQAVKDEQVRYLEQYEAVMAGVYDALPEFYLAPVAATDVDEPAPSAAPGVGYQTVGTAYSPGSPTSHGTASPAANNPGDSGTAFVPPATRQEIPAQGTTIAATVTGSSESTGPRPVGTTATPGGGGNSGGGFIPGSGGIAGGGGFPGGTPGRTPGDVRSGRAVAPTPTRGSAGAHSFGPTGTRSDREEDVEHERAAYLVERDPEGTFGTSEPTAPPVIGA